MRRARRVVLCGLGWCVAGALGCTSGQRNVSTDKATDVGVESRAKAPGERPAWVDALAERVATRRDRAWKRPPAFAARELDALVAPAREPSKDVLAEGALLFEALSGGEPFALGAPARAKYAYFDAEKGEVVFAAKAPKDALAPALAAALGEALLAQHYEPGAAAAGWDDWLAGQMLGDGEATLAALLESLDTTAEVLADRPDLLEREPEVRGWLVGSDGKPGSSLSGFTHRVGLGVVNAMQRAQGWSGVEMLRLESPETTALAARHGEWMGGQGAPAWTWPASLDEGMARQGLEVTRSGRVGSATVGAIVESHGASTVSLAMSIAMRGDHYVSYEGDGERVVVWASLWETPTMAATAQAQMEGILGESEGDGRRSRVWRDGLELVVAVALGSPDAPIELAERALNASATFPARQGFKVTYESSSMERVVLGRELAVYDEDGHLWSEPALGVKMNLAALGDGWKVDLNERGLLRWFARREEELVQLSVELADPLARTDFESPAYAFGLSDAMSKAIPGAEATAERTTYPFGPVLEVRVEGADESMRVVHFHQGTILFTYSVRGPAEGFDALWRSASAVLATLEGFESGEAAAEGELEYTIEP